MKNPSRKVKPKAYIELGNETLKKKQAKGEQVAKYHSRQGMHKELKILQHKSDHLLRPILK